MPAIPLVLDCDPGHDDMVAILLAAGSPAIDLRAITTVGGNGRLEQVTRNALLTCTLAGIHDVPVAAGCAGPCSGRCSPRRTSTGSRRWTAPTSGSPGWSSPGCTPWSCSPTS
jgi:purine nucleosidase/pyrimidine-specific ribonucleoside hydrolase